MGDEIPDRVCVDADSPYFFTDYKRLGVKFDGVDRPDDIREFCISGGWVRKELRMANGRLKMERGKVSTVRMVGKVEPYWKN